MATRAELMNALRNADAAGDTEAARRIAAMVPSDTTSSEATPEPEKQVPDAPAGEPVRSSLDRVLSGFGKGAADLAAGFADVGNIVHSPFDAGYDLIKGQPVGTSNRLRRGSVNEFATEHGANDITSTINRAAPEVLATMGPMSRAATMVTRPFLGDVALSGAYEGTKALLRGEDPSSATLWGAGGAAGGRAVARLGTGAKDLVSDNARRLIDADIMPTPGQMFDGKVGSILRGAEDKLTSLPLAGDIVDYSRRRSIKEFNRAAVNEALDPLAKVGKPIKIDATGADAIDAASKKISAAYDDALAGMQVTPKHIQTALNDAQDLIPETTLIDEGQIAKINGFINQRIRPLIERGGVGGEAAKKLDSELGFMARKFSRSPNPGDHALGEAFDVLQGQWRGAMGKGATPDQQALLAAANKAYRQMLPLTKAADRALAQNGVFTPYQAARSAGPFAQKPTSLTSAAQDVLPSRVPDSGTTGRLLMGAAVGGGGAALLPAPAAAITALSALAYSRPGINLIVNGLGAAIPDSVRATLMRLPPKDAVHVMQQLAASNPQFARQLAAQVGRITASQQPQPEEQ